MTSIDGKKPYYKDISKLDFSNSVDYLNTNEAYFFGDYKVELDSFEDKMENEEETDIIIQQEAFIKRQLREHYPLLYVIIDSLVMTILSVILIALQILATKYNAALSYLGSAIWAGLYNLIAVFLAVLTSNFLIFPLKFNFFVQSSFETLHWS